MEKNLYYEAPADEQFEELKKAALALWNTYGDPYRSEKVGRIKNIQNVHDNFMYILAMFDSLNQRKVAANLSIETKQALRDRLKAGGNTDDFISGIIDL